MIRPYKIEDLGVIKAIYNEAIENTTVIFDIHPKTDEVILNWALDHTGYRKIFVYEEEGACVAFAALSKYRQHEAFDSTVELSIYTQKELRGKGIGRALMAHVIAYAKATDEIHTIVSVITSTNTESIDFHLKYGFKHCGRLEDAGYKFGMYLGIDHLQLIV